MAAPKFAATYWSTAVNGGAIQLRRAEAALITLFGRALRPWAAEIVVIAAPKRPRELSIQEERHVGFDGAGSDVIVRDQPGHGRLNELGFYRAEVHIAGTGNTGR